jgi:hypothetical protein
MIALQRTRCLPHLGEAARLPFAMMHPSPCDSDVRTWHAGLDSASTFTIAQSLRNLARATNATIVVALLQPEPQVRLHITHVPSRLISRLCPIACTLAPSTNQVALSA